MCDLLPALTCHSRLPQGIANVGVINCNRVEAVRTCRAYNTQGFPKLLVRLDPVAAAAHICCVCCRPGLLQSSSGSLLSQQLTAAVYRLDLHLTPVVSTPLPARNPLQLFKPGTKVNPYTGGSMKDFGDFTGPVSAKALISAVTDTLDTSHLAPLSTSAEATFFLQQEPKLAKVLLFSDKPSSTVLAKGLSWAYARRLLFAEVRPSEAEGKALADKYGVDKYPTILLLKVSQASAQAGQGRAGQGLAACAGE